MTAFRFVIMSSSVMCLAVSAGAQPEPQRERPRREGVFVENSRAVELGAISTRDLTLVTPQGIEPIEVSGGQVSIPQRSYLKEELDEPVSVSRTPEGRIRVMPGYVLYNFDSDGVGIRLRTVWEIAGGGFRIQDALDYATSLFVAVVNVDDPAGSNELDSPVTLLVTAQVDQVEPSSVILTRTGDFQEVSLIAHDPSNPVMARVKESFAEEGTEFEIPVNKASLRIRAGPSEIQGLGLQVADVVISAEGLPGSQEVTVALSTDRGHLDANSLTLSGTGIGTTSVRSISLGVASILAESPHLESAETTVNFVWPWKYVLAFLLGGLSGGVLRWYRLSSGEKPHKTIGIEILVGVLYGLVVAVAWTLGVNLLGIESKVMAGEAVAFVFSALGGYWGIRLLPAKK